MWSVALADGHSDEREEIQLLAIETALGLTDLDIEDLRKKATGTL
jgi:tellurite resistance protein